MEVEMEDTEAQLVTYLRNILKCQIIPMEFMNLRDLVEDAPRKLKLYKFLQEIYPGDRFLDFLRKYPHVFTLNPNRTVILTEGNDFTLPYVNANVISTRDYDEIDGRDNEEHISNPSESDTESENAKSEDEEEHHSTASAASESESEDSSDDSCGKGGSSSSIPDSSVRDNALTSDSDASSLSSRSSVDCNAV